MLDHSTALASTVTPVLPNFFMVGAPKAGTTSLYHYLAQHPDVYMSPIKEPNYFATEIRQDNVSEAWQEWARREENSLRKYLQGPLREKRFGGIVSGRADYLKLFQNVNGEKAIGEASVCYLWSRTAARNIASTVPDAKIIVVLRDPVERAFSQYKQAVSSGLVGESFREHVRRSAAKKSDKFELLNPFLEFGLYHDQVKRYLDLFPAENVRVYLYEDYKQTQAETLANIFSFLGVESRFSPDMSEKHLQVGMPRFIRASYILKKYGVWAGIRKIVPAPVLPIARKLTLRSRQTDIPGRADRASLRDYYREDIQQLSALIRRDLSAWLR